MSVTKDIKIHNKMCILSLTWRSLTRLYQPTHLGHRVQALEIAISLF